MLAMTALTHAVYSLLERQLCLILHVLITPEFSSMGGYRTSFVSVWGSEYSIIVLSWIGISELGWTARMVV